MPGNKRFVWGCRDLIQDDWTDAGTSAGDPTPRAEDGPAAVTDDPGAEESNAQAGVSADPVALGQDVVNSGAGAGTVSSSVAVCYRR